jgi:hypothetical protein
MPRSFLLREPRPRLFFVAFRLSGAMGVPILRPLVFANGAGDSGRPSRLCQISSFPDSAPRRRAFLFRWTFHFRFTSRSCRCVFFEDRSDGRVLDGKGHHPMSFFETVTSEPGSIAGLLSASNVAATKLRAASGPEADMVAKAFLLGLELSSYGRFVNFADDFGRLSFHRRRRATTPFRRAQIT